MPPGIPRFAGYILLLMLFVLLSGNTSALGEDSGDDTFEKMVGMEMISRTLQKRQSEFVFRNF